MPMRHACSAATFKRIFSALLVSVSLLCLIASAADAQAPPLHTDSEQPPAYIYEDGFPVAAVFTNLGPLSQQARADIAQAKIDDLFNNPKLEVSKFKAVDENAGCRIYYDETPLLLVSKEDAAMVQNNSTALAKDYVQRLQNAAVQYKQDSRPGRLLFGVFLSLLGLIILVFVVGKTGSICDAMAHAVANWASRTVPIRLEIFSELIKLASTFLVRSVFFAVLVICWYIYIFGVLIYFPWTKMYAAQLLSRTLAPLSQGTKAITEYLPNLFLIAFIAYISYGIILFLRYLFSEVGRERLSLPDFDPDWAEPTFKLTRALILFMGLIVAAPYFPGWGSPAFNQFGLFLGLLVSLGSSGAISHLVAGVLLTYTRAFKIGDRVKIGKFTGDVISRTLFTTQLKTVKNEQVTLHNGQVIMLEITNYSAKAHSHGLILHTSVTIGYNEDWRKVHELLKAAALACPGVENSPEPFVLQSALNDSYVEYEINAYTKLPHQMVTIYSELHQCIQDKFNQAGVEIMSPRYTSLRDGNKTTIPSQHLAKEYRPPSFVFSERDSENA